MTQDNYNYRTNPIFLRNQFDYSGKYGIPIISKASFSEKDFRDLRLIGFDKIKSDNGKHSDRMVHFFLYDYKFERAWDKPDADIEALQKYRAVLTPDFSMYTEMPEAMLLYNVFRNRWCGAYWASKGLNVIPSVNFALEGSFDFCFEGIEKGSVVALSTYMVQEKEGREAQKDFFMAGYNEMMQRIEPEAIICYHEPFPEMDGNIIYVNYELSSWRHMGDDVTAEKTKNISTATHSPTSGYRVTKYGYVVGNSTVSPSTRAKSDIIVKHTGYVVQLGAGSAYGGQWRPSKPEDERFLGEPGEIKVTYDGNGNKIETLIGSDGRAVAERHHKDHGNPKEHSVPHTNLITWSPNGSPIMGRPGMQRDYWDGNIPNLNIYFKRWSNMGDCPVNKSNKESIIHIEKFSDFESIAEFQASMRMGAEVEFSYLGKDYAIVPRWLDDSSQRVLFYEAYNPETEIYFPSSEKLLDHVIEGKKFREIIRDINVTFRSI